MTKTASQLDADIAEALRAKQWQEQIDREDQDRRARLARYATSPTPEQLYEEYQSDLAAGVFHGERRRRARDFRRGHAAKKIATAAESLRATERAKALTDDAYSALEHRAAAEAHRYAGKRHKALAAGKDAAWLHSLAEINHRQAAKARTAEAKIDAVKATQTKRGFAAYQEKMAAAKEHGIMAEEYARQALAAARKAAE